MPRLSADACGAYLFALQVHVVVSDLEVHAEQVHERHEVAGEG